MNSIEYRDMSEYAVLRILLELRGDLEKQGVTFNQRTLRKFRDNWTLPNSTEVIDPSKHTIMISDVRRLIMSTGAESYGRIGDTLSNDNIKRSWEGYKDSYRNLKNKGYYAHVTTDPEVRSRLLDDSGGITKAYFVHEGKSIMELNNGENVRLIYPPDPNFEYNGVIKNAPTSDNPFITNVSESEVPEEVYGDLEANDEGVFDDLYGWHGKRTETESHRGLKHVLGAYLSKADALKASQNINPDTIFEGKNIYNSMMLLKHMRSKGYDFEYENNGVVDQIEVRMKSVDGVQVRVVDEEKNGSMVGRVYDRFNSYRNHTNKTTADQDSVEFNVEDTLSILDYVMGHKQGEVIKAGGTVSSQVTIDKGSDKVIFVQPSGPTKMVGNSRVYGLGNQYKAMVFQDKDEAADFVKTAIDDANEFVDSEFNAEDIQFIIDAGIDNDLDRLLESGVIEEGSFTKDDLVDGRIMVTSHEFKKLFEQKYSKNAIIRRAQEEVVEDLFHSSDKASKIDEIRESIAGSFEKGFNPAFVMENMKQTERTNNRNAMMSALKMIDYDIDKLTGNEFAVNSMKENLLQFDPETAKTIDEVTHPTLKLALKTVEDSLVASGVVGQTGKTYIPKPIVHIDDNGVIKWVGERRLRTGARQKVSGEIGQVMPTDEYGVINTKFQGENNYGLIPGYTGYFTFDGDYGDNDKRMERFRVKGHEQHLIEQLSSKVHHQITRPFVDEIENIPTMLDSTSLNGLYHGDVYGKRIALDFMETSQLPQEVKEAIITTNMNRVRFDNQFSDHATTSAETRANQDYRDNDDAASFSYWKVAGETNMRVLPKDLENIADMVVTGTGKTQGLIWYLTDGTVVNEDGTVIPSSGILDKNGELVPDTTAIRKLDYFDLEDFNAWDRTQMSAGQLMTAYRVDEGAKTALIAFNGWTFDDSYAVSQEFADRNQVFGNKPNEHSMDVLDELIINLSDENNTKTKEELLEGSNMVWSQETIDIGLELYAKFESSAFNSTERTKAENAFNDFLEENGRFRSLQRGDKLSDFGGNKGTIGIIIDRNMTEQEAKDANLVKEVAFYKANPELDVVSAPYSMLSRHNAGVVHELMSGEVSDLVDPETGEVYESAMGQLNLIVTDMIVDDKTQAYSREDVLDGRGRKASGQLAWALQSLKADAVLEEIYGHNDNAWETYREYLIVTGLDMKADGTIVKGYTPHGEGDSLEERQHFEFDPDVDSTKFLEEISDKGGFLDLPFELKFRNGLTTTELPVLSSDLRQDTELIDGSMRRSDYNNNYVSIYDSIKEYMSSEDEAVKNEAMRKAQVEFDRIQDDVIENKHNGKNNGKNSYIRDNIMGKRMQKSATAVAIVDPRLDIGEAGMNQEMMDALGVKEGDTIMGFRDPVWRDGAIRSFTVKFDDTVHGVSINPIADKSHDMDFDGDTMGLIKLDSPKAIRQLQEKFSHHANMIDTGDGYDELYFQTGMDLASAFEKAESLGDTRPQELMDEAVKYASSKNPAEQKRALRALNEYSHVLFGEYSQGSDYVSLKDDESVRKSFKKMTENGSKGAKGKDGQDSPHLTAYMKYHNGEMGSKEREDIQYASGVKSDDTGLAGAFSQKLVSAMRNYDIKGALEAMYPLTQGTLQIKHDAEHAREVNRILTEDMNTLFRGRDINNPKEKLTSPREFKKQLSDIMEKKMGVSVADEYIDAIGEAMSDDNGQIRPLNEIMALKGSPMDRVAYGGGYKELNSLADNGESFLTGEQSKMFAPIKMRNAKENTVIAKKDTKRVVEPKVINLEVEEELVSKADSERECEDEGLAL